MNRDAELGSERAIGSIGNVNTRSASCRRWFRGSGGPVSGKAMSAPKPVNTTYTLAAKWARKNKQARLRALVDIASPLVCLTPRVRRFQISPVSALRESCPDVPRARLEGLARRRLKLPEVTSDDRSQGRSAFRERGETVQRPRPHEGLRVGDIRNEYLLDTAGLSRSPAEQRQRPNDLQSDLSLVALRQ